MVVELSSILGTEDAEHLQESLLAYLMEPCSESITNV
jgi:hypothetical protein